MSTAEDTILSQYTPGFKANLNLAPQQTSTKLLAAVDSEMSYSTPGTEFNADDVMPSDPEDVSTRVPETPDKFMAFTRRVGFFTEFQDAAWLDNVDKAKLLEDPTNKTMAALMAGRWRKVDNSIITGALAVAYERPDGYGSAPTSVAFDSEQVIASNTTLLSHQDEIVPDDATDYGLSVGKIIEASLRLDDSELDGEMFFAAGPHQKADLLRRTPVTSQYYAAVKALVAGELSQFMGFNFIWLPRARLPLKTGTTDVRSCLAWKKQAIVYKARTITEARISIRNDRSDTPQAFYKAQHGISRRYDKGVVRVDCKETVAQAT